MSDRESGKLKGFEIEPVTSGLVEPSLESMMASYMSDGSLNLLGRMKSMDVLARRGVVESLHSTLQAQLNSHEISPIVFSKNFRKVLILDEPSLGGERNYATKTWLTTLRDRDVSGFVRATSNLPMEVMIKELEMIDIGECGVGRMAAYIRHFCNKLDHSYSILKTLAHDPNRAEPYSGIPRGYMTDLNDVLMVLEERALGNVDAGVELKDGLSRVAMILADGFHKNRPPGYVVKSLQLVARVRGNETAVELLRLMKGNRYQWGQEVYWSSLMDIEDADE